MSGTRGATAVDVRIAGFLLRRGHKSNCRDVSREERRELREAGLGAPSGEAPPPRPPPERHPHRRRQVLAVGRRSRSGVVVAAHLPEPVRLGELPWPKAACGVCDASSAVCNTLAPTDGARKLVYLQQRLRLESLVERTDTSVRRLSYSRTTLGITGGNYHATENGGRNSRAPTIDSSSPTSWTSRGR